MISTVEMLLADREEVMDARGDVSLPGRGRMVARSPSWGEPSLIPKLWFLLVPSDQSLKRRQKGQFDINYCSSVSPRFCSSLWSVFLRQVCLTRGRDAEQDIRQCVWFGAAVGVLVGTKTLNELEGMVLVKDELPKLLFTGQGSRHRQLWK